MVWFLNNKFAKLIDKNRIMKFKNLSWFEGSPAQQRREREPETPEPRNAQHHRDQGYSPPESLQIENVWSIFLSIQKTLGTLIAHGLSLLFTKSQMISFLWLFVIILALHSVSPVTKKDWVLVFLGFDLDLLGTWGLGLGLGLDNHMIRILLQDSFFLHNLEGFSL